MLSKTFKGLSKASSTLIHKNSRNSSHTFKEPAEPQFFTKQIKLVEGVATIKKIK